jgi:hypothetical protein
LLFVLQATVYFLPFTAYIKKRLFFRLKVRFV